MKPLKFGVVTDAHIPNIETLEKNLYNAFSELKRRKIDLLITAGDICDQNQTWAYEMYKTILDDVFGSERPQILAVSGNHDLWKRVHVYDKFATENLKKYNGQDDINTHIVLDGFHFIGVTSYPSFDGKEKDTAGAFEASKKGDYAYIKDWLEEQLREACADSNKPVFVITHFPPKHTLPGSYVNDLAGNETLTELFEKYPQVISISGHTHFPLFDERSIHQRDFTSVNAGSLHCVCCMIIEKPEVGGGAEVIDLERQPDDAYRKFPAFLYGEADDKEVRFTRLCASTGEKCGEDWRIPYPVNKKDFRYTDERFNTAKTPNFADGDFVKVFPMREKDYFNGENVSYVLVKIPKYDGRVVGFKYILSGEDYSTEKYVYTELDDNVAYPKRYHVIPLENLKKGKYKIKVFAVECYGKLSENFVEDEFTV